MSYRTATRLTQILSKTISKSYREEVYITKFIGLAPSYTINNFDWLHTCDYACACMHAHLASVIWSGRPGSAATCMPVTNWLGIHPSFPATGRRRRARSVGRRRPAAAQKCTWMFFLFNFGCVVIISSWLLRSDAYGYCWLLGTRLVCACTCQGKAATVRYGTVAVRRRREWWHCAVRSY